MAVDTSIRSRRPDAGWGEVVTATGVVAGGLAAQRTIVGGGLPRLASLGIAGGAMGVVAGAVGEGVARGLDAATPLDRTQSHLAVVGAGLATSLIGRNMSGMRAAGAASAGEVLAVTAGVGALLDVAHDQLDHDGDGRFAPSVPTAVKLAAGGGAVALLGVKYGGQAVTAARNASRIAIGGAEADAAGRAAGELVPRSKIGLPGRMFLEGATPGLAKPALREYMPHQLDDLTLEQRADLTVKSLFERGAFERSRIVIGSPTGTGGFNPVPTSMDELLSNGDTAWAVAQYGTKPSIQSLSKVDEAVEAWMALLSAVAKKQAELYPRGGGPELYAAATSLGALTLNEAARLHGDRIFGELGLKRMLLLAPPEGLSKLDPGALPAGSIGHFHTPDEVKAVGEAAAERLKIVKFSNRNDPVGLLDWRMAIKRPAFLTKEGAIPGIDHTRRYVPGLTLLQHGMDVTGAISRGTTATVRGDMHDVRGNMHWALALAMDHRHLGDEAIEAAGAQARETASASTRRIRAILAGTA